MTFQRIKILGILALVIALTMTLGACESVEDDMYDLTIEIEGEGSTNPPTGTHEYEEGTTADIEAIPAEEHEFVEWKGNVQEPEKTETSVLMESDETIIAVFKEETLTEYELELIGENISSEPEEGKIEENTEVTVEIEPEDGKQVESFEVNDEDKKDELMDTSEHEYTFTITENTTIEVYYEDIPPKQYELTIEVDGGGTTEPEPDTYEHEERTTVDIEAIPDEDYEFIEWEGNVQEPEKAENSVLIEGDETVIAHFESKEAHFEVEITDYPEEVTGEGDDIEVEYKVENTGDIEDTQNIIFSVNEGEEDSKEITLVSGDTYDNKFTYETETKDVGEEINIEIATEDDEDSTSIEVLEVAHFEVEIIDYPEEVTGEGEEVEVNYEVVNTGDIEDYQSIVFSVNEAEKNTEGVLLDAGDTYDDMFAYNTTSEDVGKKIELEIASKDDTETIEVDVIDLNNLENYFEAYFYASVTIGERVHNGAVSITNNLPFGVTIEKHEMVDEDGEVRASTTDEEYLGFIKSDEEISLSWDFWPEPLLEDFENWTAKWYCTYEEENIEFIVTGHYLELEMPF